MASGLGGGAVKPIRRITIRMDVAKAMSLLEFPPSVPFEYVEMIEIEKRFMFRIHQLELEKHEAVESPEKVLNPRSRSNKKQEKVCFKQKSNARQLNEAFQFLVQKRKRKTGRSMKTNWQIGVSKSNSGSSVINALKSLTMFKAPNMENSLPSDVQAPSSDIPGKFNPLANFSWSLKDNKPKAENIENPMSDEIEPSGELERQNQREMARKLAAELIPGKRLKSVTEVMNESNTVIESNYWLQFAFMSKENRDYFISRHGKNPDHHYLARIRKLRRDTDRANVRLPLRLQKYQNPLPRSKSRSNEASKDNNRDPRIPKRSKLSVAKFPGKEPNLSENKYNDTNDHKLPNMDVNNEGKPVEESSILPKKPFSNNESNKKRRGLDELKPGILIFDDRIYKITTEEDSYIPKKERNVAAKEDTINNEQDCNFPQKNATAETIESKDDIACDANSQENIKNKLSVVRRKLSHLNMKQIIT